MKEKEVLIEVEGLSKKFCKDLKTSLWYGVRDLTSNVFGNSRERELRDLEFWAVKDINFKLCRGECLGLIGHNGAGKSTLLKILNGLINPDEGKVTIRGRVSALIELGAGFNPILTGRENIYNNGAILGFSKAEIDAKVEEIIDFSEVREFIDSPIQNYSSGMKVRLGFAVAAQLEPDVLIIDEVLAVGDLGFVLKCFKTIDAILPNTAIVFVSHNMPMVSRICNKIILMDHGESLFQGNDVGKAIDKYYNRFASNDSNIVFDDGSVSLEKIEIHKPRSYENNLPQINWGDNLKLYFKLKLFKRLESILFRVIFYDKEQRPIAIIEKIIIISDLVQNKGVLELILSHERIQLSKGLYSINIALFKNSSSPMFRANNVLEYQVIHNDDVWPPFYLASTYEIL